MPRRHLTVLRRPITGTTGRIIWVVVVVADPRRGVVLVRCPGRGYRRPPADRLKTSRVLGLAGLVWVRRCALRFGGKARGTASWAWLAEGKGVVRPPFFIWPKQNDIGM